MPRTARIALFVVSLTAVVALFIYPLLYVTFPWTVPVPYLLALLAGLSGLVASVCN